MRTIWKFPLKIINTQIIEMPYGAEILTAQEQYDELQLWALVDSEATLKIKYRINIYGTGHPISYEDRLRYISTVQLRKGTLVLHIFENFE